MIIKILPKKLLLGISMQLFFSQVDAQSVLTINFYSGKTYKISLTKKPEITFDGDDFVINSKDVSTSFSRKAIKEFYFDTSPSSVKDVSLDTFKIEWKTCRLAYLYGENLTPVRLFDLQGKERKIVTENDGNKITLNLERLEVGVYILTVNNKRNIKIKLK